MPRQTVIEVENLRKTYGPVIAVETVSFEVYKGEIFGLVGPNGAGKTTSVECIEGLRRPDAGKLRVLGFDPGRPLLQPLSTAHSGRRPAAGTLAGGKLGKTYFGSRFPGRNFHRRCADLGENVQVGMIGKRILCYNHPD
ncbi:ATP-binding cassette domain-containing protein [bacterium]|nr:MAG: ATP-binding cassette domain-containing protein [bacterium]